MRRCGTGPASSAGSSSSQQATRARQSGQRPFLFALQHRSRCWRSQRWPQPRSRREPRATCRPCRSAAARPSSRASTLSVSVAAVALSSSPLACLVSYQACRSEQNTIGIAQKPETSSNQPCGAEARQPTKMAWEKHWGKACSGIGKVREGASLGPGWSKRLLLCCLLQG